MAKITRGDKLVTQNSKKTTKLTRQNISGFTLVEVLVVIIVIGILSTIGVVSYIGVQEKARDNKRSDQVVIIAEAFEKYYDANGEYPKCADLDSPEKIKTNFPDVDSSIFIAPKATGSVSLACDDGTIIASDPASTNDTFKYTIDDATTGKWKIWYYSEQTDAAKIGAVNRRLLSTIPAASLTKLSNPTLSLDLVGITSTVNVQWDKITNTDKYTLKYKPSSSAVWNNINTGTASDDGVNLSINQTGLSTDTDYIFSIVANGDNINYKDSDEITATIKFYKLDLAYDSGGQSITGNGFYKANRSVNASATAEADFEFKNWDGADCAGFATSSISIASISKNYSCTAKYLIPAPAAPNVSQVTPGDTTTWSWTNPCPASMTVIFKYEFRVVSPTSVIISDTGFVPDAGQAASSVALTTSAQGNKYILFAIAKCEKYGLESAYGGFGTAEYTRPIISYSLSTSVIPAGGGTVTGNAAATYPSGTVVRLTATNITGLTFSGWSGCSTSASNVIDVTMDGNKACTANFTINTPTAPTVGASTVGNTTTWSWNNTCPAGTTSRYQYQYRVINNGTNVVVSDTGWTPAAGQSGASVSMTTTTQGYKYLLFAHTQCYIGTTNSSYSAPDDAEYIRPIITYTLSTSVYPAGGGTIAGNNLGTYASGTVVRLTATNIAGLTFNSWSGCSTSTSNVIDVTMDGNKACSANFTINTPTAPTVGASTVGNTTTWSWNNTCPTGTTARYQYEYRLINNSTNVIISDTGWTPVAGQSGASVSMTTTTQGYKYLLFAHTQCYIGTTNSTYSLADDAEYIRPITSYTLTTSVNLSGAGTITGNGSGSAVRLGSYPFPNMTSFNITVSDTAGYTFSAWSGCSTATARTLTITMNQDENCVANFTINTPSAPTALSSATSTIATADFSSSCPASTTTQYLISQSQNYGSWSAGSWSSTAQANVTNIQGTMYGFKAAARCRHTSGTVSGVSGESSTYIGYIPKPAAFSVASSYQENAYITAAMGIYMWSPTSCPAGTSVSYDYYYIRNGAVPLTKESAGNYYTDYSLYDTGEGYSVPYTTNYIGQGLTAEIRLRSQCSSTYVASEWSDEMTSSIVSPVLVPAVTLSIGRTAASEVATVNGYTSKTNDIWTQAAITCGLGTNVYSRADIWSSNYKFVGASSVGWYSTSNGGSWLVNSYYDIGSFSGRYRLTLVANSTIPAGAGSGTFGIRVRPKCKNNLTGLEGFTPDAANSTVPALQQNITFTAPALL